MRDARRFDLPEEAVEAIRAALTPADADEGVWPENVAIVAAFLTVASQWRTTAIGGGMEPMRMLWIGLDYAGAKVGIEAAGMTITPELWNGLQVMEAAARDALNGVRE